MQCVSSQITGHIEFQSTTGAAEKGGVEAGDVRVVVESLNNYSGWKTERST